MGNLQEEWIQAEKDVIPEGQFIVTSFIQNTDGTKMFLNDEKIAVEIFFDGIPLLLRSAVEGIRMWTWSEIQLKYRDKSFFRNWFFFQVQNSKLTKWAIEESCDFYNNDQIYQYCIVTSEELIDVLATFKPIVNVSKL